MDTAPQVLIIEDNGDDRKAISALLKPIGVQCILVKDGKAALTLLKEGLVPAVVLLDMDMPGLDGFQVLEQIRRMPVLDRVPIIIMPQEIDADVIRKGLGCGADAYCTKPYLSHNLLDRVRVLLAAGRRPAAKTEYFRPTMQLDPDHLTGAPPVKIPSPKPDPTKDDNKSE